MTLELSLPENPDELRPRITVIGVGGAGGNAVNNMIRSNLTGVEFMAANTDSQALSLNLADHKIQLGLNISHGLGAGSRPDIGRAGAEEALDDILGALDGCHMVFITAGMGGGTGTGAAPVIARAAREHGILTVGVVTKPFHFEGRHRMRTAEAGIEELASYVDTLIVIPNQNLFRIASDKTTFAEAFHLADDVLHSGVRGVTDLMVKSGLINLDFADIRAIMLEMGKAMMGTGEATGENRAVHAAEAAISNPLLDDASMKGARGVLINITGGPDMTLFEVDAAANRIRDEVDPEANIIFGATSDDTMYGAIRVSVVATGIDGSGMMPKPAAAPAPAVQEAAPPQSAAAEVAQHQPAAASDGDEPLDLKELAPIASVVADNERAAAAHPQSAPQPQAIATMEAEEEEPKRSAGRSSIWSMLTGGSKSGNGKGADKAEGRRAQPMRDDIFVPPQPVTAPRQAMVADAMMPESDVRPLPAATPAARQEQAAADVTPLYPRGEATLTQPAPAAQPAPPTAQATTTDEGNADAYSEEVLEIPAFLRRQAN